MFLADRLGKPVLVEGPAGTGKTQLAKSVSEMTGARLIRLQCYEGLDESKALYEWNYKKQLLRIQAEQVTQEGETWQELEEDIFSEPFLMPGHYWKRSGPPSRLSCSSTKWTASRSKPKPSSWRCCRTTRSRCPRWARCRATQNPIGFPHFQ